MNKTYADIGFQWLCSRFPKLNYLAHYGIKGMKWGVRRSKEELERARGIANSQKSSIIEEAIASGMVLKKINREKQLRHTKSHHIPGRSYLDGDLEYAQNLVDRLSGTGEAVITREGVWLRKEKVVAPQIIGTHVGLDGIEKKTNKAMISYSKTGTHIYPRKEEDEE